MNHHPNALAAKVTAVNLAHSLANQYGPILKEFFRPYVGQKVTKTDGSFLESIKKELPKLPDWQSSNHEIQTHLTTGGGYSIRLEIRVTQAYTDRRGEYSTISHEVSVYIADLTNNGAGYSAPNQFVKEIYANQINFQTDYKAEEIIVLRKSLEEAEKVVSDLKSKIHDFGTYDR